MPKKRYRPEEIIAKLRQAKVLLGEGRKVPEVVKTLGVHEVTYHCWRKEYGGLQVSQAKRLKDPWLFWAEMLSLARVELPEHQSRDQRRRLFLHRRDRMRIGVERDRDGGVSEALGDDLRMDAGLQRQGGMCVPEVVQADRRQHRLLHGLAPVAADAFRV